MSKRAIHNPFLNISSSSPTFVSSKNVKHRNHTQGKSPERLLGLLNMFLLYRLLSYGLSDLPLCSSNFV